MSKNRRRRMEEELRKASKDVGYELRMLITTAETMNSLQDVVRTSSEQDARVSAIRNSLVESFAIHARNLRDFLYIDNPKHEDDIVAVDYFDGPSDWVNKRPEEPELLKSIHPKADKQIAHLSYMRQAFSPEEKKWRFEIVDEILKLFWKFTTVVPPNLVSELFLGVFPKKSAPEGITRGTWLHQHTQTINFLATTRESLFFPQED